MFNNLLLIIYKHFGGLKILLRHYFQCNKFLLSVNRLTRPCSYPSMCRVASLFAYYFYADCLFCHQSICISSLLALKDSMSSFFQEENAFTREKLNAIANQLVLEDPNQETWTPLSFLLKPHHNTITGNYDINVLIAALEGKGKKVVWHDRRRKASSIDLNETEDTLMGIILNIPVRRYGGFWKSRHWVTLRKIKGVWYNLDSDLVGPLPFKDESEIHDYLDNIIGDGGEVLLIMNDKL